MTSLLPIDPRPTHDRTDALAPTSARSRHGRHRRMRLALVELLALTVVLTLLICAARALAEPAQQFNFRVMSAGADGRIAFTFTARTYDTTGAVPPPLTAFYLRLPVGAGLRQEFLTPRWLCNGRALRDALDAHPSATPFTRRIADLRPFIRSLVGSPAAAERRALANARACERGRIGEGTAQVDGRPIAKALTDLIPVRFSVFLSRGAVPGATAGFAILGAGDERSAIVRRFPILAGVHAALIASLVHDPTPDGVYGAKLLLPTGRINGLDVRIAEARATLHDLVIRRGTCLRRRGPRCAARVRRKLFSFTVPTCPPSGLLSGQVVAAFPPPTPTLTTTLRVPCPRYVR
jgi:hypothetical protein